MNNDNIDEILVKETEEFLHRFSNDKDFQQRVIEEPVASFKEIFSQLKDIPDNQVNEIFKAYKKYLKQGSSPQTSGMEGFRRDGLRALAGAMAGAAVAWAVSKYSLPGPNPAE